MAPRPRRGAFFGSSWISGETLLVRHRSLSGDDPGNRDCDAGWARWKRWGWGGYRVSRWRGPSAQVARWRFYLGPSKVMRSEGCGEPAAGVRDIVHRVGDLDLAIPEHRVVLVVPRSRCGVSTGAVSGWKTASFPSPPGATRSMGRCAAPPTPRPQKRPRPGRARPLARTRKPACYSAVSAPASASGRSTNSTKAMGALSPGRKPHFRMRI